MRFSEALCRLDHGGWYPQVLTEGSEKSTRIADDAAVSRLRTIPDGPNQWEMHRSSARTVGFTSLSVPAVGTESVPGSGPMGTCATCGSPPYT
jgi:hypothetical protein